MLPLVFKKYVVAWHSPFRHLPIKALHNYLSCFPSVALKQTSNPRKYLVFSSVQGIFMQLDTASVQSFVSRFLVFPVWVLPLSRCLWRDLSLQAKLVRDLLFALQAGSTVQKPYMHWQWLAQVGRIDKSRVITDRFTRKTMDGGQWKPASSFGIGPPEMKMCLNNTRVKDFLLHLLCWGFTGSLDCRFLPRQVLP